MKFLQYVMKKIEKSTDDPVCAIIDDNGGYTVHPVPVSVSTILLINNKDNEGGSNQNLILFIRGKAISGAPSIIGTNQFPNPPIKIGITIKKNYNKSMSSYNYIINLIISN